MATKSFDIAKRNKADEFYTQLSDIEKELAHYREYFKEKTILCNSDDPFESNFFKYFAMNFNNLVEMFPSNIVAKMFKFVKYEFFKAEEAAKEVPKVKF